MSTTSDSTKNQKLRLSNYQLANWLNELKKQDPDIVAKIEKALQETSESKIPGETNIFRAYESTPFHKVKVVILGNDPYPDEEAADGLAFSYAKGKPENSPAIVKIFHKVKMDNNGQERTKYTLDDWAKQGVLLLNTSLTFPESASDDDRQEHRNLWQPLISATLSALFDCSRPIVFLAWGEEAISTLHESCPIQDIQDFLKTVGNTQDEYIKECATKKVIVSAHPTAGQVKKYRSFSSSDCFKEANKFLAEHNEIDWLGH